MKHSNISSIKLREINRNIIPALLKRRSQWKATNTLNEIAVDPVIKLNIPEKQ